MSQERFNSLNQLCEESKKVFSSIGDAKKLNNKMMTIISSEDIPLNNEEIALVSIINDRTLTNYFDLVNKINTENIPLSDEDLLRIRKFKKNLPEGKKIMEEDTKKLEEISDINLQKIAQNRRDKILKIFEPAEVVLNQVIQKEKTRRANNPISKQIASLQNQIKILEKEIRDNNSDPEYQQQELEKLKAELQKKQEQRERERKNQPIIPPELLVAEQ